MSRLEEFKRARKIRRKYMLVFALFIIMVVTGVCISDYSVNSLMMNDKSLGIIEVHNINNAFVEINIMNRKYYINITYIDRDYEKLKKRLSALLHGG